MSVQVETRTAATPFNGKLPNGNFVKEVRKIPASRWKPMIHPRAEEVGREVEGYFLQHWNFPTERARTIFLKAGFPRVTCLYFPLAKDDRIHFACRLLTVLFLIDDILEDMSFADGEKLNNRLIELSKGPEYATPDRSVPAEFVIYDLWESMRAHDLELANQVLEPTFVFMRSQTDKIRLSITELGEYLRYREKDVGKALLSALMRFSMELNPTPEEMIALKPLEENCSKHLSIVNDIWSYEKEVQASKTGHKEGSYLCSAVKVVATETGLSVAATKRVLWHMVREWEMTHEDMCEGLSTGSQAVKDYIRGLEYQMSGNELWSETTPRYLEVDE
ncbi:Aristolochene synthase [Annulohypoxylon truncatum]|uniref:Aristolochene synthase n=1 Tax=Annulohypoxylon truncatum TaxID=327061 RepID=UPI0020073522|nr:Aristolochene synthase [Annulohypoxylon truncatum]KAI1205726.1 Aristolochene synthase [Annulohypoxylon truncatum]